MARQLRLSPAVLRHLPSADLPPPPAPASAASAVAKSTCRSSPPRRLRPHSWVLQPGVPDSTRLESVATWVPVGPLHHTSTSGSPSVVYTTTTAAAGLLSRSASSRHRIAASSLLDGSSTRTVPHSGSPKNTATTAPGAVSTTASTISKASARADSRSTLPGPRLLGVVDRSGPRPVDTRHRPDGCGGVVHHRDLAVGVVHASLCCQRCRLPRPAARHQQRRGSHLLPTIVVPTAMEVPVGEITERLR